MTITSFGFLFLVLIGLILYYISPKSWQWIELLILSLIFYYFAATPYTIIYVILATAIAYASTMWIQYNKKVKNETSKHSGVILAIGILLNLSIWFIFKGRGFWAPLGEQLLRFYDCHFIKAAIQMELVSALGMGYYTLQVIGYMVDCYWDNVKPQSNPLKLLLFVGYFPQMTTGPISRYSDLTSLFEKHTFIYENISLGAQRILWGFFKKLVLAERVGIIVSAITDNPDIYSGFYYWIALLLYPIQMYSDFSGCMDIVLGVSQMFGISLAENFNNPFFSRTSQEFWQRWHITLGTWAKDYVLYPLLKTRVMIRFGKSAKRRFGKRMGRFIASALGMLILWLVMGIWHGGIRYIVGVSIWYWIILMLGELLSPVCLQIVKKCRIKTENFSWHLFQSLRTYFIYAVGAAFFSLGITKGIAFLHNVIKVVTNHSYNPWIFFNGEMTNLGITFQDMNIIVISFLLLLVVAILREKYGYARTWVCQQGIVFRWLIWLSLFTIVLIWGMYGPDYDSSIFIYQGF